MASAILAASLTPAANAQPEPPRVSATTEVTASRTEESILQAPVAISVVRDVSIDAFPSATYSDLLRSVPGTNTVQTSARDFGIRTRGAAAVAEHRQLTLIDGRPVYLDFYGIVLWDALPIDLDGIRQIEVQRGPGSALWGPNAFSGVINIRTKSPRELPKGTMTATLGERGTRGASIRLANANDRYAYKLSTSFFEQDGWPRDNLLPNGSPIPGPYLFSNRGTRQPKIDARVDWGGASTPLWSTKAGFGGTSGIFHSRLGPFAIEQGTYAAYAEVDRNTNTTDTKLYWNRLHGDAPNLINGLDFKFGTDAFAGESTSRRAIGSHSVVVYGVSVRQSRYSLSIAPRAHIRDEGGAFGEVSAELSARSTLNAGLRFDTFTTIGTVASPRVSFIVQPRPDQSVRLAYNRAYRAPSVADSFLETSIPNAVNIAGQSFVFRTQASGNEKLAVELIDAIEAGYTLALRRTLLTASVYRNAVHNNIVFVPTVFYSAADPPTGWPFPSAAVPASTLPKTFSFINIGRVVDRGLELSWDVNWTERFLTRFSSTLQSRPRVSDATGQLRINQQPRHISSITSEFRTKAWFASASATYCDKAFWADVLDSRFWGFSRPYFIMSVGGGSSIGRGLQLVADATNVLDRRIKEHVFGDTMRRRAVAQLRYRF